MRYCARHRRQHEVADSEEREMGHGCNGSVFSQDQKEYLYDIMIALEVGQYRVPTKHFGDDIR